MIRWLFSIFGILILVFIIAALPTVFTIDAMGIHFMPMTAWDTFKSYLSGIANGDSFHYREGLDRTRNFLKDVDRYFEVSYLYLTIASFFGVTISTFIGIWQGKMRIGWVKDIFGLLGAIPDFILILLLQLGVAAIYESTGVRVAKAASMSTDDPAVLLPLITLALVPAIYLMRTLSEHTYDQLTEDYVLTARSKGMAKIYILFQHATRNVLPYLKADLHKVASIMIGNLFIVEYLYNVRGVTRLIFSNVGYQYNLVVDCLLVLIILYFFLYWTMRLFVLGLERIFAYD